MIDRSKAGGHRMCKPICEARRLVSSDEVESMKVEADLAAEKASKHLEEMEASDATGEELEEARAEDDAAKQRKNTLAEVAVQFEDKEAPADAPTIQDQVEIEDKETLQVIK